MRDEVDFAAALSRLKVLIGVSPDVDINLADKLAEIPPPTENFRARHWSLARIGKCIL